MTSPVESTDRINGHQPCSHLITSAIEQFDDYLRSKYQNNEEINSYIDRLNSDILTNGSYSDLNILSSSTDNTPTQQHAQPIQVQTIFKPVNNISSQSETVSFIINFLSEYFLYLYKYIFIYYLNQFRSKYIKFMLVSIEREEKQRPIILLRLYKLKLDI